MVKILDYLKNRITLQSIPFTDYHSRLMVFYHEHEFHIKLAESWSEDAALTFVSWQFVDRSGQPLEVERIETMPHRVDVFCTSGQFILAFADLETLLIELPPQPLGLKLIITGSTIKQDRLGATIDHHDEMPLHLSYTTNATIVKHKIDPIESSLFCHDLYLAPAEDKRTFILHLTRTSRRNRYIPNPEPIYNANEARWRTWFSSIPNVPMPYQEQYTFAWWVLGINLIRSYFYPYHDGMIPSKVGYVGIWNWDSYFHVIALRHQNIQLAQDQFRILFDHQLENGMLPDVVQDNGALSHTRDYGIDADITKPPLTAWAIWKIYEVSQDKAFLDEMYDRLVRSHRWWSTQHNAEGFAQYAHPYSSGLDNSPLFDDGLLETPDLTAYLILQSDMLARIASEINLVKDSHQWRQEAENLTQKLIDMRWDADTGLFWPWRDGQAVTIRTPLSLMPLITGRLPQTIAERLVSNLTDTQQFWGPFPVPTVAIDDPNYDPSTMWRGPVWININYLLIEGLQRSGFLDIARQLRQKTLNMILQHNDIYEYYHPINGRRPPRAVSIFGWSSALFIDLVLQEVGETSN
ncbi:MAG: hypothetical protein H6670_02410 [Anaerolineaceae bacterium]|nr:hypothetical protein [Anaerolineaceae bacterium]